MSVIPSPNPFIHGTLPRQDESPQEKTLREQEEARAKAVSDAIDEQIKQDKVTFRRYQKAIKILLLGQSESGKSTTIKNFQLKYAYSEWAHERSSWKTVIHLNLIRSVTTILEIMNRAMKDQQDRQRSLSPSRFYRNSNTLPSSESREFPDGGTRELTFDFSDKHKLLQLRLQPLIRVQRDLEKCIGSAALEPDKVPTAKNVEFPIPGASSSVAPHRQTEFSVSVNGSWKTRLLGKEEGSKRVVEKKSIQDLHDATEIICSCGSDIKQLWADDVVQQVLKVAKAQLEHSSGFFMDDTDRIVAKDYEPSDQDVVKARLRTVGIQEYHFIIPGTAGREDWILYDVGGSRASRNAWTSYFDDINSIIFLAPVSCFDQRLAEDTSVNRLEDSLLIWKYICNSKLLANIQLILFLNKIDLLKEKLESGVRFDKYVINYGKHPNNVPSVTSFLKQQFKSTLRSSGSQRVFYCYLTSAADTDAMARTLATVYDGIIRGALDRAQFL